MEECRVKDNKLEEEISDKFICCVCLELLYKPVVLSCGHLSCFWCIRESMNGLRVSHCPICRHPYFHFPSVCQKIHFLLKKIYPLSHKKRKEQVLKIEQERGCFSPQIDAVQKPLMAMDKYVCSINSLIISDKQSNEETFNVSENDLPVSSQISKDDLLCSAREELLVRPLVLNCGHVYCHVCVVDMAEESGKIKCRQCKVCDPRGFPKLCLVLEQLLEEHFLEEYTSRKTLYHKYDTSLSTNNNREGSNVHNGISCDSCGVYPIIGDRYRCKDCKEKTGYDLCKDCHESSLKVAGRFNQKHTRNHRFELADHRQLQINLSSTSSPDVTQDGNERGGT